VLNLILGLRLEIELYLNEKDKVVAEFSDEKWLWDLALLCDVSRLASDLNTKVRGQ
jgi:hypothetical protein